MFTEKERLFNAIDKKDIDRPPCICPGGMMNMVTKELMQKTDAIWPDAHSNSDLMTELSRAVYTFGLFENYGVPFCMTVEAEAMGSSVNFGDMMIEPHIAEYCLKQSAEWNSLKKIDFESGRAAVVLDSIKKLKEYKDGVPIIGNLTGPVSVATSVLDPNIFYRGLKKHKEASKCLMNFISEQIALFGIKQLEAGADCITISDPSATGEILGPAAFKEFAIPYINQIIDKIKSCCDTRIIVHICGNMNIVKNIIADIKADALSFDSMVNIKDIKKELEGHTIMGNINTYMLEFGSKEKIRTSTLKCINDGFHIISPACGLGVGTGLENISSILSTIKEAANVDNKKFHSKG